MILNRFKNRSSDKHSRIEYIHFMFILNFSIIIVKIVDRKDATSNKRPPEPFSIQQQLQQQLTAHTAGRGVKTTSIPFVSVMNFQAIRSRLGSGTTKRIYVSEILRSKWISNPGRWRRLSSFSRLAFPLDSLSVNP